MFCPVTLGPHCGRPGSHSRVRFAHVEVLGQAKLGGLDRIYRGPARVQHSPMGSGLTVDALECITFSGHVAAPDPSMWWGQALLLA
jgi:hypothetical protein